MTPPTITKLCQDLPPTDSNEAFEALLERPGLKLERIVSRGHATPPGEWYDQEQDEWVAVLAGAARLRVEHHGSYELGPGDSLLLPARCRHRVDWTDPDQPTVWLALHVWP
ncbi:cupin domain-containing protein [Haliangium sp.]|uniref:cupin domain-containing protein n=1 Tax=Haliangium sp. TaxID=2663208 RepID=UPI003D0A82EF